MQGMSERQYAAHAGVSPGAVQKARAAGRLVLFPDGSINVAASDARRAAMTDPAKQRVRAGTRASGVKPVTAAATGAVRDILREQGLPSGSRASFAEAHTIREIAMAQLARQKLQERRGELVDRARATALVFRLGREERDAWLNWPARIAALIAAELGVDTHAVQKLIETHVRDHLAELAEIRAEFR